MTALARRRLVDGYVGAVAVGGAVVTIAVLVAGRDDLGEQPLIALFLAALLAVTERFELLLLRGEETEGLQLEEALLVTMALVLPAPVALGAFALGATAGQLLRRRPVRNAAFNAGQAVLASAAAVGVMHLLSPMDEIDFAALAAAVAGAAVYFVINNVAVALVIALVEGTRFRASLLDPLPVRLVIWAASASLGLLMGLAVSAYPWVLPCLVAPLAMLYWSFTGHLRAWRAKHRMDGLFSTAMGAHAAAAPDDVVEVVTGAARRMLSANRAEIRPEPPVEGELGAAVRTSRETPQWLVVGDRRGVEPFGVAEDELLRAVAAIGAAGLDRAQLYEAAEEERHKLADIVQSSSDGIFSLGTDQRISSWNPAMERVTGVAAANAMGGLCSEVFAARDEDGNLLCGPPGWGRLNNGGGPVEVQVETRNGSPRWMTCTYSPLPDGGYVVVARDVTAQKEAEGLKTDFLAMISHELRTPLTPIKGFLHTLLVDRGDLDAGTRQDIYGMMLHQTDRLTRLVLDLLDATSLGDPSHLILVDELDWPATINRTVEVFRHEQPDREVQVEIDAGVPAIIADEQRADQILTNLLENAARYSPAGSPITVRVRHEGDMVSTTVSDRGPGIAPADREHIFERFRRLGNHLSRPDGGLGLGLYIARHLVEGMGGSITVGDAPEGGAAFTFLLPVPVRARGSADSRTQTSSA